MADSKPFERREHEHSDVIPGVDAGFVADLYDCAAKFGEPDPTGQWRILSRESVDEMHPLFVSACVAPGSLHMKVLRMKYNGPRRTDSVFAQLLSDPLPSVLIWDRTVSPWEVRELVAATDAEMVTRGVYDPATGGRPRMIYDAAPPKYAVDDVFVNRESLLPLGRIDPQEYLRLFDRPDELGVVYGNDRSVLLCHKKSRRWRMTLAADAVSVRWWGKRDPERFNTLSGDDKARFLAEIMEELRRSEG